MPRVTAIMPCLGRAEQTLELIPRLLATAEYQDWSLACVVDGDEGLYERLYAAYPKNTWFAKEQWGYWKCLRDATIISESELVVNLANDLLPGRGWLSRAIMAYDLKLNGGGVVGFNDGIWNGKHAAHFLTSKALLHEWYGGDYWPVCYQHMYGDTEICQRATALNKFYVEPFAVLYHNHKLVGAANDEVYQQGESRWRDDQALFQERRKQWSN